MKEQYSHRRSGVFLMEIILAILFFSLASAMCLRVFVKSHNMSLETESLNRAIRYVSSAAETLRSADSEATAGDLLADLFADDDSVTLVYGEDLSKNLDSFDPDMMVIAIYPADASEDGLTAWHIAAYDRSLTSRDLPIYDLNVEVYYGE